MKLALDGIRVLDFSQFVVGPWATSLLADYGADVIKVERPGSGDGTRNFDRVFGPGMSSYYVGMNRGKRSLELDIARPEAKDVLERLLARTDVLIANFRPGVLERLGLGYEQLAQRFPRLIYVSITAFGETGPLAGKPAMDIVVQAVSGIMGLTGEPGRAPVKVGAPVADYIGAYLVISSVMMALFVRITQGIGQKVDVQMIDGQVSCLANFMAGHAVTGRPEGPQGGGHPQLVPYQVFATSDSYVVVGCLTEGFWRALCEALERNDLTSDSRFALNPDRVAHRDELIGILSEIFLRETSAQWILRLEAGGVPCAEVASLQQVAHNPQLRQNEAIVEMEHPTVGPVTLVGNPIHLRGTPPRMAAPAARLGEHTRQILSELGYDAEAIDTLSIVTMPTSKETQPA